MTPLPTKLQICFVWQAPQWKIVLLYKEHSKTLRHFLSRKIYFKDIKKHIKIQLNLLPIISNASKGYEFKSAYIKIQDLDATPFKGLIPASHSLRANFLIKPSLFLKNNI